MKRIKSARALLDPEQAHRIRWRGVRLAQGVYRAFCSQCNTHLEAPTEREARSTSLICQYCREDNEIKEACDRLRGGTIGGGSPYTVLDETEGYQSNAIRELEDAR